MENTAWFLPSQLHGVVSNCDSTFWQKLMKNATKVFFPLPPYCIHLIKMKKKSDMHPLLYCISSLKCCHQLNYFNIKLALRTNEKYWRTFFFFFFLKTLIIGAWTFTRDKRKHLKQTTIWTRFWGSDLCVSIVAPRVQHNSWQPNKLSLAAMCFNALKVQHDEGATMCSHTHGLIFVLPPNNC